MEKSEFRVVIKHYYLKGKTSKETKGSHDNQYGESAPPDYMVKYWIAEFKRGRTSIQDGPRSGRPKSAITPEIIAKVHDMVLDDRRVKVREIDNAIGISNDRVHFILQQELHMKKLSARWMPNLLMLCMYVICMN